MSVWDGAFHPATYGPIVDPAAGPWRTLLDPGQLAPQDLQANEVCHFLRHDAVLQRVFGGSFNRLPWLGGATLLATGPRLIVHLVNSDSSERPTATVLERSSVFITALWDLAAAAPIEDGAASAATVMAHVKRVLRATRNRVLTIYWNDEQVALAETDMAIGPERFDFLSATDEDTGLSRPFGVFSQVEVTHTLKLDKNTGQFTRLGEPPT